MCLSKPIKPRNKDGFGYKVLRKRDDGVLTNWDCSSTAGTIIYPIGKWLHDKNRKTIFTYNGSYSTGFHVSLSINKSKVVTKQCTTKERALVLVKVQYKNAHAKEGQPMSGNYGGVIVTRDIKVLSVID